MKMAMVSYICIHIFTALLRHFQREPYVIIDNGPSCWSMSKGKSTAIASDSNMERYKYTDNDAVESDSSAALGEGKFNKYGRVQMALRRKLRLYC